MKAIVIIPARMQSSRLPNKPLADIQGRSLVMRVYDRAVMCSEVTEVIIATDHLDIYQHARSLGAKVLLTSPDHPSGTDRIAEVASNIVSDIIVNVQGDEPFIDPRQIDQLIRFMKEKGASICTQCTKISDHDQLFDYNVVKLTKDKNNKVLYFSRQAIPCFRDLPYKEWFESHEYLRHVGIYAFRKEVLMELSKLTPSAYEQAEKLEQLRWLEAGYDIYCQTTKFRSIGVDTQEDLERAREYALKEMFY